MVQLTEKQTQALRIVHDALDEIRILAMAPVTPETMAAIYDLADALHNVPVDVARQLENPTLANIGETIQHDIESAAGVYKRAGLSMRAFPPDVQPRDADRSHYVDSGARLKIRPQIAAQYTYGDTKSRRELPLGASLVLFFKRFFG